MSERIETLVSDSRGEARAFAIESVLGEGGSAVVYAAIDDGAEVALKVLREASNDRDRARFLKEAELLGRVCHPHLVAVRRVGVLADGRPFLALERLRGETLATRLARGPLARVEALASFAKVADAVATLHESGLLHRDIKPENVFLRAPDAEPVLLDLGIAQETDAPPGTTTGEGAVRGTRATMAPERLFGTRADVASEVYELGLLLYAMLTGGLPWGDEADAEERLHAAPPDSRDATIPVALSDVVMSALAMRPSRRPASIRAFMALVAETTKTPNEARTTASVSVAPLEGRRDSDVRDRAAPPTLVGPPDEAPRSAHTGDGTAAPVRSRQGRASGFLLGIGAAIVAVVGFSVVQTIGSRKVAEAAPSPIAVASAPVVTASVAADADSASAPPEDTDADVDEVAEDPSSASESVPGGPTRTARGGRRSARKAASGASSATVHARKMPLDSVDLAPGGTPIPRCDAVRKNVCAEHPDRCDAFSARLAELTSGTPDQRHEAHHFCMSYVFPAPPGASAAPVATTAQPADTTPLALQHGYVMPAWTMP